MKKIRILFILFFLCGIQKLQAQDYNSLLWEISGKGITKPSYIFGTEHTKDSTIFAEKDLVLDKLKNCSIILSETDESESDENSLLGSLYMKHKTLEELMTEQQYEKVRVYFRDSMQIDVDMLKKMKPIMLVFMTAYKDNINQKSLSRERTYSTLDDYIINTARIEGLPHRGLEDSEDYLGYILDYYTLPEQVNLLMDVISEKNAEQLSGMRDSYLDEDLDELYKTSKSSMPADMFSVLLKYRNDAWLEIIPSVIQKEPAFIVVGAMHLPGSEGLINGLRNMGYTVSPLKTSSSK